MDSQSHRASPTRAEAVQGTLGVQPTGPQPTGSGKLGFAGPLYWWTPPIPICWASLLVNTTNTNLLGLSFGEHQHHQACTKENDHWPLEQQQQPSSTTTITTTLAPLKPYYHVTLAESSGNCALQIHFDPANFRAGSEGGWKQHIFYCAGLWGGKLCMYHTKSHNAFNTDEAKPKKNSLRDYFIHVS